MLPTTSAGGRSIVTNDGSTPCLRADRRPQRQEPRQPRVLDQQVVARVPAARSSHRPSLPAAPGRSANWPVRLQASGRAVGHLDVGVASAGRRGSRPPTATPRTPCGLVSSVEHLGLRYDAGRAAAGCPATVLVPDRPVPATRTSAGIRRCRRRRTGGGAAGPRACPDASHARRRPSAPDADAAGAARRRAILSDRHSSDPCCQTTPPVLGGRVACSNSRRWTPRRPSRSADEDLSMAATPGPAETRSAGSSSSPAPAAAAPA